MSDQAWCAFILAEYARGNLRGAMILADMWKVKIDMRTPIPQPGN